MKSGNQLKDSGRDWIFRLFVSWMVASLVSLLASSSAFQEFSFFSGRQLLIWGGSFFLTFVILSGIRQERTDRILSLIVVPMYGCVTVWQNVNLFYGLVFSAVTAGVIAYALQPDIQIRTDRKESFKAVIAIGVLFSVITAFIQIMEQALLWTECFDFGIFLQMFHYMRRKLVMDTTVERDVLLSHFAVHISPIWYVLLPFFAAFPYAATLSIAQAVIVGSGVIPLWFLCRKYKISHTSSIAFALIYAVCPAMMGGCIGLQIHENCFLAPFILWMLYFLEEGRFLPELIFAILIFLVKEDAAFYVAVIALYQIASAGLRGTERKKEIRNGLILLAASVLWFVMVYLLLRTFGEGTMDNRYSNFMYDGGNSILTVVRAVIRDPAFALAQIASVQSKLWYLLRVLVPLAFLPLLIHHPSEILLLAPLMVLNLIPAYENQYNIYTQYNFGSSALLFYLAVQNYRDIRSASRRKVLAAAVVSALLFACCNNLQYLSRINAVVNNDQRMKEVRDIRTVLKEIPKDASVTASDFLIPQLSDRDTLYMLGSTTHEKETEYVVCDLRYENQPEKQYLSDQVKFDYEAFWKEFRENPDYRMLYYLKDEIVVYQRVK